MGNLRSGDIRRVAERIGHQQDFKLYSTIGLSLSWNEHDKEAIPLLEEATRLKPDDSHSRHGLTNAYSCTGEYSKSIRMGIEALKYLPLDKQQPEGTDCWYFIKDSLLKIGKNGTDTLEWARENLGSQKQTVDGMAFIIISIYAERRDSDVVDFVKEMQSQGSNGGGEDRLYRLFVGSFGSFRIFALSAAVSRKTKLALQITDDVIAIRQRRNQFVETQISKYLKGQMLLITGDETASLQVFESVRYQMRKETGHDASDTTLEMLDEVDANLAYLYFELAVKAKQDGAESLRIWEQKLEELNQRPSRSSSSAYLKDPDINSPVPVTAYTALWYRLQGQKTLAKRLLSPLFARAVRFLQDNDLQNDASGYQGLAMVLLRVGDIEQALAALTPLMGPFSRIQERHRRMMELKPKAPRSLALRSCYESIDVDKSKDLDSKPANMATIDETGPVLAESSGEEPTLEPTSGIAPLRNVDDEIWGWQCSGGCQSLAVDELFVCEYCQSISFICGQCLPQFRSKYRSIYGSFCKPYHPQHRVYPVDKEREGVATFKSHGRTFPRSDWLERLKAEWARG